MPTPSRPGPSRRPVQAVTSAGPSVEADRARRMRSYLLAMGFRTVAFPLAVWAIVSEWYVVGSLLVVAAAVLPSVAVMLANAVDRRASVTGPAPRSPVQGLGAGRGTGDEEPADEVPVTDDGPIVGTVVSSRPADDPEHREAS